MTWGLFRAARLIGSAVVLSVALAACGGSGDGDDGGGGSAADGGELTEVTALLPFLRVPAFYPMILAEELGYFEEEGISASWEPTDGSAFAVQQVAAGNADVAVVNTEPAILGFAESENFKVVYNLANETTGHLNDTWALASSGLESHLDLEGQKIGVKDPADGAVPGLRAALEIDGLSEGEDYELVPLGESPAAQASALVGGDVAAFRGSRLSLVALRAAIESEGEELVCLSCDAETEFSSLVVIASNSFIEEHPDVLAGLGRALAKATVFGEANPERAVELMMEADPETNTDADLTSDQLLDTVEEMLLGEAPSDQYGFSSPDGLANTMELLLVPGLDSGLSEAVDVDNLVTNDFVEKYNDFDRQEIADDGS
jgi:NitT/TauT family transport system substrate-binding protein